MKLKNFVNDRSNGFAGAAFQAENGEMIFVCRGTEPHFDKWNDLIKEDLINIGINGAYFDENMTPDVDGYRSQFDSSIRFVKETLNNGKICSRKELNKIIAESSNQISFAGHSLGGGLAAYLAYYTDPSGKTFARTFNAVGTAKMIPLQYKNDGTNANITGINKYFLSA